MEITAALAADLAVLTQTLDEPGTDIAETLRQFAADARRAVPSYLGLSLLVVRGAGLPVTITALEHGAAPSQVQTTLRMPLPREPGDGVSVALILYAARPGAFVDLAADLCWMIGERLSAVAVDEHLLAPAAPDPSGLLPPLSVLSGSAIDQATGVLIGRGFTPAQAQRYLAAHAAESGVDVHGAADRVLAHLDEPDPDEQPG